VVRPLLRVRRSQVLAFLGELGQDWRQDSSNADPRHTRNRIRHELLPHVARRYNPAVVPTLCRLAEQADEARRSAEAVGAVLLREAELPRAGAILVLDRERLGNAPRHVIREAFRLLWLRESWSMGEMGFREWDRVAAVVLGEKQAVDLPRGVRVQASGKEERSRVVRVTSPVRGEQEV
jgi:tRNA(Ile)-lysidine synthase